VLNVSSGLFREHAFDGIVLKDLIEQFASMDDLGATSNEDQLMSELAGRTASHGWG
jgi:hypothetical protein